MNALKLFKYLLFPNLYLNTHVGAAVVGGVLGVGAAVAGKPDTPDPTKTGFAALPAEIQERLLALMDQSQGLADAGDKQFFPGSTFAPFTDSQQLGLANQLDYAQGLAPQLNDINNSFGTALDAGNIFTDPSVMAGLNTIESRANQNFAENTLPALRRGATSAGQEFGTRGELAAGVAGSRLARDVGDAQSTFLANQLGSSRALQGSALSNAPNTLQLGMLPGSTQFNVGSLMQQQDQLGIDEAMERFNFNQAAPDMTLDQLIARISGLSGIGGGASIQPGATPPSTNPVSGALGGALLASQIAPGFSSPTTAAPAVSPTNYLNSLGQWF